MELIFVLPEWFQKNHHHTKNYDLKMNYQFHFHSLIRHYTILFFPFRKNKKATKTIIKIAFVALNYLIISYLSGRRLNTGISLSPITTLSAAGTKNSPNMLSLRLIIIIKSQFIFLAWLNTVLDKVLLRNILLV